MASESASKSSTNTDGDDQSPPNDSNYDTTQDPWEIGLRRRRRDATARETVGIQSSTQNNNTGRDNNMAPSHQPNNGAFGSSSSLNPPISSFSAGGSCGNGVVALSTAAATSQGGSPSPFKTPTKESSESMLVPITPSTETISGETAESTLISSPRSHRGRSRRQPSLRRQYQLLENQAYLLLGTTSIGFMLFLLFTLPFFALMSLALMTLSLVALGPVATSAIRTRYQLELEQPMGLLRYLPDSIRILLTETTLHEYMTDSSFMMENGYLLLYFIPGIRPDQLMNFINQLPQRHRDALLQPGLGRFMPSLMNSLVRTENFNTVQDGESSPLLLNRDGGDSTSSLLTLDGEDGEGTDREVTLIEAITSLRQTVIGRSYDTGLPIIREIEADEASERALGGEQNNPTAPRPREVVVELPPSVDADTGENEQQQDREAEYAAEGQIMSDAYYAAMTNYSSQATAIISETASGIVETASSLGIRLGSYTGVLAGSGGIVLAVLHPSSISFGLFGQLEASIDERRVTDHGSGPASNRGRIVYGLLATSAVGFVSAGLSYMIRNRVRAIITRNRDARESSTKK